MLCLLADVNPTPLTDASVGVTATSGAMLGGATNVIAPESGHTLILGWSPKIVPVLQELVIANESQKRPVVVVLADRDKVEMEEQMNYYSETYVRREQISARLAYLFLYPYGCPSRRQKVYPS